MAAQLITPELKSWIVAQATAGHPPDIVLDAMKASGWDEDIAIDALETTMREHLAGVAVANVAAIEPARPVPGRQIAAGTPFVRAADREVKVVMALTLPRVVVFADLISADECAELIALARTRLARSETVETATGSNAVNPARTSDGMFFQPAEFPVCGRIEQRIAALLDWPLENGEGLQVLRYGPGTAVPAALRLLRSRRSRNADHPQARRPARRLDRLLPEHARGRRRDRLPRRRPRGRAGARQRRLLQLRPAAPGDAHPARRRRGQRRRKVGGDEMDARGPIRVTLCTRGCQPRSPGRVVSASNRLSPTPRNIRMKTLIAAIVASAVSFGAFAQSTPATPATSAPAAKPTAVGQHRQEEQHQEVELDFEQEAPQQQPQGVGTRRLSAPARTKARSRPGFFSCGESGPRSSGSGVGAVGVAERPAALDAPVLALGPGLRPLELPALDAGDQLVLGQAPERAARRLAAPGGKAQPPRQGGASPPRPSRRSGARSRTTCARS